MKTNDILTLARAGFTAQQISALASIKEPETQTQQTATQANNQMQNNLVNVNDLMQTMQAMNILNANQPKTETVDDILASIINPQDTQTTPQEAK